MLSVVSRLYFQTVETLLSSDCRRCFQINLNVAFKCVETLLSNELRLYLSNESKLHFRTSRNFGFLWGEQDRLDENNGLGWSVVV